MTIDSAGRAHKPAGSPASTGGQFAEQAAPAAAATLHTPTYTEHDVQLRQQGMRHLDAELERLRAQRVAQAANIVEAQMSVSGLDRIEFEIDAINDRVRGEHGDVLEQLGIWDELPAISAEGQISMWSDAEPRYIDAETLRAAREPQPIRVADVSDAEKHTAGAYTAIRDRFTEIEHISVLGIAATVRERFPHAAGIRFTDPGGPDSEGYLPYYRAAALIDDQDRDLPDEDDAFYDWIGEQEETEAWPDALISLTHADTLLEGSYRQHLRFHQYAIPAAEQTGAPA